MISGKSIVKLHSQLCTRLRGNDLCSSLTDLNIHHILIDMQCLVFLICDKRSVKMLFDSHIYCFVDANV